MSVIPINMLKVVSLFSGCGGLDLGFAQAGFTVVYAVDCDKSVWPTYTLNHPRTFLDRRKLHWINSSDIPDCLGIIGGPPCQSWSEAGSHRGIEDGRGQVFYEYLRIVQEKQPVFFLAENVKGILAPRHKDAFSNIICSFEEAGYNVSYKLLNALDYNVPQDRKRVFIVGIRKDKNTVYQFPKKGCNATPVTRKLTLHDAISDLSQIDTIANCKYGPNQKIPESCRRLIPVYNHEYLEDSYSSIYMSRNRVRAWDEPSFAILASARHIPLHPQASKMIKKSRNSYIFDPRTSKPYRRLSVRECARIQTFKDDFVFKYDNINDGYKMVGNAVPVNLAKALGVSILKYFIFGEFD